MAPPAAGQRCGAVALLTIFACGIISASAQSPQTRTIFDLHSKSQLVGPASRNGEPFSDVNTFLDHGPISRLAFQLTSNNPGFAVTYGQAVRIARGGAVSNAFGENVNVNGIILFTVQWLNATNTAPGQFISMSAQYADGTGFTLGRPSVSALTMTQAAPPGGFLGCFEGETAGGHLTALRLVWFVTEPSTIPVLHSATNFIVASSFQGDAFDHTKDALRQGRIARIAAKLGPQPSLGTPTTGMVIWYNDLTRTIGNGGTLSTTNAQRITSRIARVRGSYLLGNTGYFAHMTFMATNGLNFTVGVESTSGNARTFDVRAPPGTFLGAFKGRQTSSTIRQLAFVWFRDQR